MNEETMKQLFYFSLSVLIAMVLLWFGSKFLFFPTEDINGTVLLLAGIGLVLGGVFMVTTGVLKVTVIMVILGFYFCARATGTLELPWLARLFGVACWLAAFIVIYFGWPRLKKETPP